MELKDYAGKYFLWENGLRFKVLDKCNEYGDWIAQCPITEKTWPVRPEAVKNSTEITEEEAKKQFFDISTRVIQAVMCGTCCGWKCGKEEFSAKTRLGLRIIPADEINRLQDELRKFFVRHGATSILPYIHPTFDKDYKRDGGLEISFIAREALDESSVDERTS